MQQINWHLGQTLLPEHFNLAQTHRVKQSIEIAQANCPTDYYGLADLDIDAYLLTKNILKIRSLFYIKASGDCIHFQASDQNEPLELNLNMLETDTAMISLQINKEPLLEYIKIATQDIQLKAPRLSLSVNSDEIDELHCIKLLTLQKYEDGTWELCEDLPPLLNTSPYSFKVVTNALYTLIHVVTAYIKHECGSNSALAGVKFMQLQNVELALQKLKLCLAQLKQNKQHPYSIYQYLIDIYLNLMQYKSDLGLSDALVYDHAHPWKSFEIILNTIRSCVQYTHSVEYKSFNLVGNTLTTGTIDYEILNRKKHYLVIRKPAVDYLSLIHI